MLFKDIVSGQFKVFARMKEAERDKNIATVRYIQNLASMAGVDVSGWDANGVFGFSGKKLISDKNEINRRFFEELDRLAKEAPTVSADLITDEVRQQLKIAETRHVSALIAKEQLAADARIKDAIMYFKEHEKFIAKAGEHFAAIRRLTGQGSSLEEQVRTVSASTFWAFHGVSGNGTVLEFVTRSDVVLTYKNAAAGIDITLNFGRFKAKYSLADFSLHVVRHERNIVSQNHIHPHIGSSGGVCWGTAAQPATQALAKCQFVEPMTLLATILMSYNPGSPYQSLERFQEVVGSPEDLLARDKMNRALEPTRARMRELDRLDVDLDRGAQAPAPAAAPMNALTSAVPTPTVATVATASRSSSQENFTL